MEYWVNLFTGKLFFVLLSNYNRELTCFVSQCHCVLQSI